MKGLYAQLDGAILTEQLKKMAATTPYSPEGLDGAFAPFCCSTKQFTCRIGPSGWPLFGAGCWISPRHQVHALILDIATLREASLHDVSQLEKVLEHKRFRTWKPTAIRLDRGSMAWIPFGKVVCLSTTVELAEFLVIPWMHPQLAEKSTEDVWQFVATSNISFGNKNEGRAPWRTLLPALREFSTSLWKST